MHLFHMRSSRQTVTAVKQRVGLLNRLHLSLLRPSGHVLTCIRPSLILGLEQQRCQTQCVKLIGVALCLDVASCDDCPITSPHPRVFRSTWEGDKQISMQMLATMAGKTRPAADAPWKSTRPVVQSVSLFIHGPNPNAVHMHSFFIFLSPPLRLLPLLSPHLPFT